MYKVTYAFSVMAMFLGTLNCLAQSSAPKCDSSIFSIPFLTKADGGWDLSFTEKSSIIRRGEFILGDGKDSGLQYTEFQTKKQVTALPHIEVNPCNHTGTIRTWYALPKKVFGFEKNGHLFAYQVGIQMIAGPSADSQVLASNTYVIFYDMHGNGVFDSVRLGAGIGMPLVPDWVQNTPPKAEKDDKRIRAKGESLN